MTGIVTGLEQAGPVEATAAGKRLLMRARANRIDAIAGRIGDLTSEEIDLSWKAGQLLEARFGGTPWRPLE